MVTEEHLKDLIKGYPKVELTAEQEECFRKAAEILVQNKKDCEQFKDRDGI